MAEKDVSSRLRRAVKENNLFLVKRLVQRTNMRNIDSSAKRYTSLAWAAALGHVETFEFLLSAGHDDEELSKDSDNNTILMLLADLMPQSDSYDESGEKDIQGAALRMALLYLDRYRDIIDWSNTEGKTCLHIGSLKGNEELVRMLCDWGADVNLPDNKGNTPLHYASSWGHIPVVQLLIDRGSSFNARNNEGFSASDYAYSYGTRDTLQDAARLQVENSKRNRRNANGTMGPSSPPPTASSTQSIAITSSGRKRSGSGTTATSESSIAVPLQGLGIFNASPSYANGSTSPAFTNTSKTSIFSHAHAPSKSFQVAQTTSAALSPVVTRMRERDAEAMAKYNNRNRSGSASTDTKSANGSATFESTNSKSDVVPPLATNSMSSTPLRRLRPSLSAAQLRTTPQLPTIVTVSPTQTARINGAHTINSRFSPTTLVSHAFSGRNNLDSSKRPDVRNILTDTNPSNRFAQYSDSLYANSETPTPVGTTGGGILSGSARRLPFNLLSSKSHIEPPSPFAVNGNTHRRGSSAGNTAR